MDIKIFMQLIVKEAVKTPRTGMVVKNVRTGEIGVIDLIKKVSGEFDLKVIYDSGDVERVPLHVLWRRFDEVDIDSLENKSHLIRQLEDKKKEFAAVLKAIEDVKRKKGRLDLTTATMNILNLESLKDKLQIEMSQIEDEVKKYG